MIDEKAVALAIAREMHKGGDFGMDGDSAYEARPAEFLALARAAIAALSPGSTGSAEGWQPWATVPRDEEPVLATNDTVLDGFPQVVMFVEDRASAGYPWGVPDADIYYPEGAFTHWRRDCLPCPSAMIDAAGGRE